MNILDIAVGGTNYVNVSIKDIVAQAVKLRASKIIFVHNHPSGISLPSKADIDFTDRLLKASKLIGIELLDHIVIAEYGYSSIFQIMLENGEKL